MENLILTKPVNRKGYAEQRKLEFSPEQPVYEVVETEIKFKDLDGNKRKYSSEKLVKTKRTKNIVKEIQAYSPLTEYKSKVIWTDGVGGQNLQYIGERKSKPYYADHSQLSGKTLSEFTEMERRGEKAKITLAQSLHLAQKSKRQVEKAKAIAEAKKQLETQKKGETK